MSDSIFKTETTILVDAFDLGDLIRDKYQLTDRFEWLEANNDTDHRLDVTEPDSMWDKFTAPDAEQALNRGYAMEYEMSMMLERLCRDGHIQRGVYVVSVCW